MLSKSTNLQTATNLFEEANQLKQAGQLQNAIISYRRAAQLNPNFPWIYHNLGEVLAENGQLLEAMQAFQQAVKLNPDSAWSQYQLAEVFLKLGNLPNAIERLTQAIAINPYSPEFYNSLGNALFKQGDLEQAITNYRKTIELDPENAIAYQYLGEALAQQGELDESLTSCQKAIELNPNLGDVYQILGTALVKKGLFQEALNILLEALDFNQKSPKIYHALGDIAVHFQQWNKAIDYYSQAIQLKPNVPIFHHNLGNVYAQLYQWEDAIAAYSQAIAINPESADCHQSFAEVLAKLERWDAAISSYSKALELNPDLTNIYPHLAEALKQRGTPADLEKANQYYQKAIEFNADDLDAYEMLLKTQPNNLELCWKYANLLWSKNQREQALIYYKKVKEANPQDFEMLVKLGEAFVRMSQFDDAIAIYNKALEINPNSADVYHRLGEPLEKNGQLEEAAKTYQKAIELNPHFFGSYHNLGDIRRKQNKVEEAVAAYQKATELNPHFHWSYHNIGDMLLEQPDRLDEAAAAYQKAIAINPHFAWSYQNLGTALLKQGKIEEAITAYRRAGELDPVFKFDVKSIQDILLKKALVADHLYSLWVADNFPREADLKKMAETLEIFRYKPLISIIMPVYNTPTYFLREAIDSVLNQVYPDWEFCIADDSSTDPHVKEILEEYVAKDSRIKVVYRTENGHISKASNSALELATGEFISLLDHDDTLTPDALYEVVLLLNRYPDADMIYSDEDKLSPDDQLISPFFKPEWSPESFFSRMYTCHLGTYRHSIIKEIGGWRIGYEGAQDYDLVLRFTEKTEKIYHIPKILYHWRMHPGSAAGGTEAKPYAYLASQKALQDAIDRRGEKGEIQGIPGFLGHHLVRYEISEYKRVSIIIPTRDLGKVLDRCLESIFTKTGYPNYEVILIDNGSVESYTAQLIEQWYQKEPERFKCYRLDIPFNFSKINNYGVSQATGDYLLFLNNDTEAITSDWLNAMVEQVQRPAIGAVGALLLFPDNTIQHAGVIMGLGGVAGHPYYNMPQTPGYFSNVIGLNNTSAVTGACLMCRRDAFEQVGGFDEELTVAYNDVDLCLKLLTQGYRNLYLPHVVLYHHESKSRGYEDTPEKKERLGRESKIMESRWQKFIDNDPYYSPHLSREFQDYRIKV
ncbi:hypothetical protein PCC9214_03223 [Planktothrix tepida]|uniref:Glycosyl transferase family 2 n=1 Tax=Planktothrix tepida PCC 9214 TaxID=671072 RepID=A0A1J1LQB7_9CYAN